MGTLGRKKEINLSDLSRKTGYSISHLSRVVSGETKPSVDCLVKISNTMKVSVDEFLNMIGETDA